MNPKRITKYEIIDHGVEHESYFQGCGVSHTKFDLAVTGIGNSLFEALEDAAEQLMAIGIELSLDLLAEINEADNTDKIEPLADSADDADFPTELYYRASIRVKGE